MHCLKVKEGESMVKPKSRKETSIAILFSLFGFWVAVGIVWLIMPEDSCFLDFGRSGCSFWIGVIFLFMVIIAMKSIFRCCRGRKMK